MWLVSPVVVVVVVVVALAPARWRQFSYFFCRPRAPTGGQRLEKEIDQQQKRAPKWTTEHEKDLGFFSNPFFPFLFFLGLSPAKKKKACPWRRCLGANLRMRHTHTYTTQKKRQHNGLCRALALFFFLALWFLGHLGHSVFAGRRLRDERQSKSGRKKICGRHCNKQKKDGQTRRGRALGFWGIHSKLLFILFFCPQCAPPPAKERQASGEGKEKKGDTMGRSTGAANGGPLL